MTTHLSENSVLFLKRLLLESGHQSYDRFSHVPLSPLFTPIELSHLVPCSMSVEPDRLPKSLPPWRWRHYITPKRYLLIIRVMRRKHKARSINGTGDNINQRILPEQKHSLLTMQCLCRCKHTSTLAANMLWTDATLLYNIIQGYVSVFPIFCPLRRRSQVARQLRTLQSYRMSQPGKQQVKKIDVFPRV
jgi:hypothetical protein